MKVSFFLFLKYYLGDFAFFDPSFQNLVIFSKEFPEKEKE